MMILLLAQAAVFTGNKACELCHKAIFENYRRTPMARSSGPVAGGGGVPPGAFRHTASGINYRVDSRGIAAGRKFTYFIGSGAAGRSYLFTLEGFLFQAPITWYSQKHRWDMSPGYEADRHPLWNRAVTPNCLFCHASQARPVYGTVNRYAEPPFIQDGVGCERCHGPGSEHIAGRGRMVNPAKLDPARRDSVCSQCHLAGEARVEKSGRQLAMYRAGDLLADVASYFVAPGGRGAVGIKATGYVERFQGSRCKQVSGDKIWCGSCHDPHTLPTPERRVAYFRQKCMSCHRQPHADAAGLDCISCHMPRERVVDGGHGVLTDHGIPRKPLETVPAPPSDEEAAWKLEPFLSGGGGEARELGLAYAEVGVRLGSRRQQDEAIRLLSHANVDSEVAVRLADLLQRQGQIARAEQLYRAAMRRPPVSIVALVNLGIIVGSRGDYEEAVRLGRLALEQNPGQREAAINLVGVLRALGRMDEAAKVEESMRRFEAH